MSHAVSPTATQAVEKPSPTAPNRRRFLIDTAAAILASSAAVTTATAEQWVNLDGRSNAPTGRPQHPNLLTPYGTRRPPWKVAGVDYRVGVQSGVVLKPIGQIHNPNVQVDTANRIIRMSGHDYTVDGFDFSGWTLYIQAQRVIIQNCKSTQPRAFAVFAPNTDPAPWFPMDITFRYCEMSGFGVQSLNDLWSFIALRGGGTMVVEYCWLTHSCAHIYETTLSANSRGIFRYNLETEIGTGDPVNHVNFTQVWGGSSSAQHLFTFNCMVNHRQFAGGQMVQVAGTNSLVANNTMLALTTPEPGFSGGTEGISHMFDPGHAGEFVTGCVIRDNYIDNSGVAFDVFHSNAAKPSITVTGNKNMLNGKTINKNNSEV